MSTDNKKTEKHYDSLTPEIEERIRQDRKDHWVNPYAFRNEDVIREYPSKNDGNTLLRPAFVRDVEKIINNPYYNRYSDKTQVFSLQRNDDITRRALHVQLVARIARNIGSLLGLNTDLIEAISLGHDIGHTPFGHDGEYKLSELYQSHAGRNFNHNIQSARVFMTIYPTNLSLQTLDGIICHNGELELQEYRPVPYRDFTTLRERIETTYTDQSSIKKLIPATLEGCVMRISDIIAYLGKDLYDAQKLGFLSPEDTFSDSTIGSNNAEIINNLVVNIVNNSYGKDHICMSEDYFHALQKCKKENGKRIYANAEIKNMFTSHIYPMMERVYEELLREIHAHDRNSIIYKHHINYIADYTRFYPPRVKYEEEEENAIVCDFIASMTDDYFIDLYEYLFGKDEISNISYRGYFEDMD